MIYLSQHVILTINYDSNHSSRAVQ